ncbi:MAG: aldehyde-activating protein [Alphaproteobacteria bacterium]|nr:MAG: aldehyde-activating protein [Alphaproteobacteria bacterium]
MSEVKTPIVTGGCQCGKVRYALYVAPQNAHVCHCRMCQRATGGVFAALAGAPKSEFAWTGGEPAFFASSNLAKRAYCRDCGTPLSFSYDLPEARFYVTIGSMDDPEAAPIVKQYGVESRISWVKFCEDVPAEKTGEDPKAAEFFKTMQSNQG